MALRRVRFCQGLLIQPQQTQMGTTATATSVSFSLTAALTKKMTRAPPGAPGLLVLTRVYIYQHD